MPISLLFQYIRVELPWKNETLIWVFACIHIMRTLTWYPFYCFYRIFSTWVFYLHNYPLPLVFLWKDCLLSQPNQIQRKSINNRSRAFREASRRSCHSQATNIWGFNSAIINFRTMGSGSNWWSRQVVRFHFERHNMIEMGRGWVKQYWAWVLERGRGLLHSFSL